MSKPRIILVDEKDTIIGYKDRADLEGHDIYRVAALWITNSKGDILLARRHHTKSHHPNKWGPAVAGTVEEGETYESNIMKEAKEEIGLINIQLQRGPKIEVHNQYHHFVQWYTLHIDQDIDAFTMQEDEVEEIKWIPPHELEKQLREHPETFLPMMRTYYALFGPLPN